MPTYEVTRRRDKPRIYFQGGGWGNAIDIRRWPDSLTEPIKVVGWKCDRPCVGDIFEIPMQGGKVGVCEFVKVEYCHDPYDMFFADCLWKGYKENDDRS